MATSYKTPGVYIQEVSAFPHSIPIDIPTAVPAFIGYTQMAKKATENDLDFTPFRINSLVEFQQYFGSMPAEKITLTVDDVIEKNGATEKLTQRKVDAVIPSYSPHIFWYQLQLYFDNGGGPCYIIATGRPTGVIDAQHLLRGLQAAQQQKGITLLVFPEGGAMQNPAELYALYNTAMQQAASTQDRFVLCDVSNQPVPEGNDVSFFRKMITGGSSEGLRYGAAYYPYLQTGIAACYAPEAVSIIHHTLIKETGKADTNINGALHGLTMADEPAIKAIDISFALRSLQVTLPPSCAVAGLYCLVDNTRGVWNAPANVSINNVMTPVIQINNNNQVELNAPIDGKSINAIRSFTGKGVLVWGARTLDGNSTEWRYIPVRRTCIMIETVVAAALQQFVFEPNDANTWINIQALIENYLTELWKQGALQGAKPEHAFAVQIGLGKTMTNTDLLEGMLRVQIMISVVRPAEFLVLSFQQKMAV